MKAFIIVTFLAIMSWEPSCDPVSSGGSDTSSETTPYHYNNGNEESTVFSLKGKVYINGTTQQIYYAEVCIYKDSKEFCKTTNSNGYYFYFDDITAQDTFMLVAKASGYRPDSVILGPNVNGKNLTHFFRLIPT